MKRILVLLFMLMSLMTAEAQINQTIWGVTLGKSTQYQVKIMLERKGYKIQIMPDGSYGIEVDNVSFGGAFWSWVNFSFVNGYLSEIWFQNNKRQSPVDLYKVYDKLHTTLNDKYMQYHFSIPSNDMTIKSSFYSDNHTLIILSIWRVDYQEFISLSYGDENLSQAKKIQEYKEL